MVSPGISLSVDVGSDPLLDDSSVDVVSVVSRECACVSEDSPGETSVLVDWPSLFEMLTPVLSVGVVTCAFEFSSDGISEHALTIKDKHRTRLRARCLLGFFRMGNKTKAIVLMRRNNTKIR